MRTHTFLLGLVLGSTLAPLATRDPAPGGQQGSRSGAGQETGQEQETEPPAFRPRTPPLTDLREQQRLALEEQLLGAWNLVEWFDPNGVFDPRDYSGFLIFADGYCSVHFHAVVEGTGVLGLAVDDFVQSEIYRYRIDDLGMLQMASTMGFNTLNSFFELTFVGNTAVKEYNVQLFEGQLELTTWDGRRMILRQVVGGEFPLNAIQKLQRTQGGRFETPLDRANRPKNFLGEDR